MNKIFAESEQIAMPCRLTLSDGTQLTDEIISLTYTAGCASSTTGPSLGASVAANFTVKLAGALPALEGANVTLEVQTGDDTWTSLGKFRFETPETGENVTTVTAVDAMLWAMEQGYYPSESAPATALDVLRDVCIQAKVELGGITGARNLIQGTQDWSDSAFYINGQYGPSAGSISDGVLTVPKSTSTIDTHFVSVSAGEILTVSVDVKSTTSAKGSTILLQYYDTDGTRQSNAYVSASYTTEWTRINKTFTIPEGITQIRIGLRSSVNVMSYRYLQLERGASVTDWSPAPEDIDVSVTGTLTGYTMREMAGYMAALLGRNAIFAPDGKLELRWYAESNASIGPDNYYSGGFTRKDYDWVLSGLNCSTGSNEEDTLSVGTAGSVISMTDPYMTQSILESCWTELEGFSYRPGEVTLLGDLSLEPGDLVTVTDRSGNGYTLAIMAVEHSYDGGWKTKISAYGSAESDTGANYKGPVTIAMERYTAEMASFKKLFADEAYLQNLFVSGGIIANDISAVEISASKYLTGVTIVGDVIQANTLTAEKLILKGEDGLIYEINAQAGGLTSEQLTEEQYQNALDGSVLVAHSVTADRINVTDLFAQDITATGTIRGVKLIGATGEIGSWTIRETGLSATRDLDGNTYQYVLQAPSDTANYANVLYVRHRTSEEDDWTIDFVLNYDGSVRLQTLTAYSSIRCDGDASFGNMLDIRSRLRCSAGSIAIGNAVPGVIATSDGNVYLQSAGTALLAFYPDGGTTAKKISASSDGFTFNANIAVSGDLSSTGSITSEKGITSGSWFSSSAPCDTQQFRLNCIWADGTSRAILSRDTSGLVSSLGWDGSADYNTRLDLRSRTVRVVNSSGTSTLSDERMKKDWKGLGDYDAFFDALNPQAFRYIDGSSGRYHLGFGAQSVEQALADSGLDNSDFAGLVHYPLSAEDANSQNLTEEYSLIYTEFVALLTDQIQKLKQKVESLEKRIETLERTEI
ncbi:MAG: tail fiber domain-containing protein [Candidatus Onthomonas sp.]